LDSDELNCLCLCFIASTISFLLKEELLSNVRIDKEKFKVFLINFLSFFVNFGFMPDKLS